MEVAGTSRELWGAVEICSLVVKKSPNEQKFEIIKYRGFIRDLIVCLFLASFQFIVAYIPIDRDTPCPWHGHQHRRTIAQKTEIYQCFYPLLSCLPPSMAVPRTFCWPDPTQFLREHCSSGLITMLTFFTFFDSCTDGLLYSGRVYLQISAVRSNVGLYCISTITV